MGDGIGITLARETMGYTAELFAKKVGITEERLISFEANPEDIPAKFAKRIANSLNLAIDDLDFLSDNEKSPRFR